MVPSIKTLDQETTEFIARLKEPPVPNSPSLKLTIEILEEGGSLEDLHPWEFLDGLISQSKFIYETIKDLAAIKDQSMALRIQAVSPVFKVPNILLNALNTYLKNLGRPMDAYGNRLSRRQVLDRLPYWPYGLVTITLMLKIGESNAKGWNKRRWANTLRDLRAEDCPLGKDTKRVAIYQYRMALALADEFKNLPQAIDRWRKRLGLPRNEKHGWAKIVKPLVGYLSPFYPATRKGKRYNRTVRVALHHEKEAISRTTFKIAANILHLAYPAFWPRANASSRVKNLYHAF
jgi:hypothetical protein